MKQRSTLLLSFLCFEINRIFCFAVQKTSALSMPSALLCPGNWPRKLTEKTTVASALELVRLLYPSVKLQETQYYINKSCYENRSLS